VLFKYTPDTEVSWRSVWLGAAVSMGLLAVGSWAYGVYLAWFGVSSAAGVAGSVFLGLALVYYAVSILLYGMEVVREVHSRFVSAGRYPAE
jgi:membrane protein